MSARGRRSSSKTAHPRRRPDDPGGHGQGARQDGRAFPRRRRLVCRRPSSSGPAEDPTALAFEPEKLDLAIGSTAQLKLIGKYKDNSTADLTGRAEWSSLTEGTTFCYRGLVEGLAEGAGKVRARYRSSPEGKPLEVALEFQVAEGDYKDLTIDVEPKPLIAGKPAASRPKPSGPTRVAVDPAIVEAEVGAGHAGAFDRRWHACPGRASRARRRSRRRSASCRSRSRSRSSPTFGGAGRPGPDRLAQGRRHWGSARSFGSTLAGERRADRGHEQGSRRSSRSARTAA